MSTGAIGDGDAIESKSIDDVLALTKISPIQRVKIPDGGQKTVIKPTSGEFNIFQFKPESRLTGGFVVYRM